MTNAEREAEHVKALAAACFQQMTLASQAHTCVAQIHAKWGNHPAFKAYLKDMALELWMKRFIANGPWGKDDQDQL